MRGKFKAIYTRTNVMMMVEERNVHVPIEFGFQKKFYANNSDIRWILLKIVFNVHLAVWLIDWQFHLIDIV